MGKGRQLNIQRAYNEGYCDGANYSINILREAIEVINKAVVKSAINTIEKSKPKD